MTMQEFKVYTHMEQMQIFTNILLFYSLNIFIYTFRSELSIKKQRKTYKTDTDPQTLGC